MKHEYSKGQQMKTDQVLWKAYVVASQATETRHPSKTALHHPAPGQQDKAVLRFRQFDDFQLNTMLFGLLDRCITGVSLINEGEFARLASRLLHCLSQLAHLRTVLLIGKRDMQRQQMTQGIDRQMHLLPKLCLAPL